MLAGGGIGLVQFTNSDGRHSLDERKVVDGGWWMVEVRGCRALTRPGERCRAEEAALELLALAISGCTSKRQWSEWWPESWILMWVLLWRVWMASGMGSGSSDGGHLYWEAENKRETGFKVP